MSSEDAKKIGSASLVQGEASESEDETVESDHSFSENRYLGTI